MHIAENDFHQENQGLQPGALYEKKNFTGKKSSGNLFIDTRKRFLACNMEGERR